MKLLMTLFFKPKLRSILKAELAAFYQLFILRPLEPEQRTDLPITYLVLGM